MEKLKQQPNNKLAEKLDKTLIQASLFAEQQLPQYPDVPYSPALAKLRNKFRLLRMLKTLHYRGCDLHFQIREGITTQYEDFKIPDTVEELESRYKKALVELIQQEKVERANSKERHEHLEEKARQYSTNGELSSAQYLKRLKQCEDTARVFQKCAFAHGKNKRGGFASIEGPADPNIHPKNCTHCITI